MLDRSRIPTAAGIGLRTTHLAALAAEGADAPLTAAWVEVHSETFLCAGGPRLAMLDAVAARYAVSCHSVGLSLGSAEGLNEEHLARLADFYARVRPVLISDHLAWSVTGGAYLNDLLPLPYTPETLDVVTRNVEQAQRRFKRPMLVENPSLYVTYPASTMGETEFLTTLVARTGCGLLLDVNNIYVSMSNSGAVPEHVSALARGYIDALPAHAVGEVHLAGHGVMGEGASRVLIDTHGTRVCDEVWELYRYAMRRLGPCPTLIEWDADVPEIAVLAGEAARAQAIIAADEGSQHVS